jgi:hypothetical protein
VVGGSVRQFITNFENRPLVKFAAAVTFTDVLGRISTGGDEVVPAFVICCQEPDGTSDGYGYFCHCNWESDGCFNVLINQFACVPDSCPVGGPAGCSAYCDGDVSSIPGITNNCP